ncbi:MAG: hypothetical protein L0Y54_22210 [Sporichthyaceae bacterium]|nr:hypothetical protein [Sporichthyaceae bacterium]
MATAEQIRLAAALRLRRALVGLAAVALFVAGSVAWLVAYGPATGAGRTRPARALEAQRSPGPPGPADLVEGTTSYVAPERWVRLPAATRLVDEFPVGFPHTAQGGMAVAVARLYTAPAHAAGSAQRAADAALAWRARLGAPPSGPLPPQLGVSARPVGVQWTRLGPDRLRVSVLAELLEFRGPDEPIRRSMVAITAELVWADAGSGADWALVPSNGRLPTPPPAELGAAGFNDAGWVAIGQVR